MENSSHTLGQARHGARRNRMHLLLALTLAITAFAGLSATRASAEILIQKNVWSYDGGALVRAALWQHDDGALVVQLDVLDTAADGRCAHGTVA